MIRQGKLIISLLLMMLVITVCSGKSKKVKTTAKDITPAEAMELIEEHKDNPDFIILDVRTPDEFAAGHIENAILIDYYEDFKNQISRLDKSKIYLVYCRSGNRSGKGMKIMTKEGFTTVYNMKGGINSWRSENLPVVE